MTGWLVVNGFLQSAKFEDLYGLLAEAFARRGVALTRYTGDRFVPSPVGAMPMPWGEAPATPDFVLFWDKDVALARRFEDAGVRLFNPSDAIAACDDKRLTARALVRAGVTVPRTLVSPMTFSGVGYASEDFLDRAVETLGLPCVIKEAFGSFGAGVRLVEDRAAAHRVLAGLAERPFVMQEFVAASRGRDVRVNVVGGEAVCAILRENPNDFRSNVSNGGTARAWPLTDAFAAAAVAATAAVGADFAGVDVLFGARGEPVVCEVNSNPHFRSTLEATGVNLADLIATAICGGTRQK